MRQCRRPRRSSRRQPPPPPQQRTSGLDERRLGRPEQRRGRGGGWARGDGEAALTRIRRRLRRWTCRPRRSAGGASRARDLGAGATADRGDEMRRIRRRGRPYPASPVRGLLDPARKSRRRRRRRAPPDPMVMKTSRSMAARRPSGGGPGSPAIDAKIAGFLLALKQSWRRRPDLGEPRCRGCRGKAGRGRP